MRILIGFILALSVSFACDQPYEEVGGYKIGCPFEVTDEHSVVRETPEVSAIEYTKKISGMFDAVSIIAVDKSTEIIEFSRAFDRGVTQADIDDILTALNKKWGDGKEDEKVSLYYTWSPDSPVIGQIIFTSSEPNSSFPSFTLSYTSKKILKIIEKEESRQKTGYEHEEEKRKKELSTY